MRMLIAFLLTSICTSALQAQKYGIEKSHVEFYSHATIEDIKADNAKASGLFNSETSDVVFSIPITEFQFAKSLMQEHFNEKYMESDKYPKSTFQGKVTGFDAKSTAEQQVHAVGKLSIHGVSKEVDIPGTIARNGDHWIVHAKFPVKLADYNIAIPQLLWQNIAEQVDVTVDFDFKPQSKK